MKRTAAVLLLLALPASSLLSAKGTTVRIAITGGKLQTPIKITQPDVVEKFNVWSGPGTRTRLLDPASGQWRTIEGTEGFIIDWRGGEIARVPDGLQRYEVSFFAGTRGALASSSPMWCSMRTIRRATRGIRLSPSPFAEFLPIASSPSGTAVLSITTGRPSGNVGGADGGGVACAATSSRSPRHVGKDANADTGLPVAHPDHKALGSVRQRDRAGHDSQF
jgi:hypothetical protein